MALFYSNSFFLFGLCIAPASQGMLGPLESTGYKLQIL